MHCVNYQMTVYNYENNNKEKTNMTKIIISTITEDNFKPTLTVLEREYIY